MIVLTCANHVMLVVTTLDRRSLVLERRERLRSIYSKRQVRLDSYSYCKIKEAGMLTRKPRKQAVIDTFRHKTYQLR